MESKAEKIKNIIGQKAPVFAEKIVEIQYKKQPQFWKPYGSRGRMLSVRDAEYHLPFLAEAIVVDEVSIFENYVAWVKKLFRGLNFPDEVMIVTLESTNEVLASELPEELSVMVDKFIRAGLEQMKKELKDTETYIHESFPLGAVALQYNNALLNGNRKEASRIVLKEAENGTSIKDIYLNVFQKSQYEIGRLWLENKITVAKEHFCTAATQQIMSQLYPYIFSTERIGKTMVAANVGKELHEIGIRMVADFFEMEGWDTYYLGANAPASTILQAIEENNADLVGLSIAIPHHITTLRETISSIREKLNGNIKILIGGYALNEIGNKWKDFYADGFAPNAQEAIQLANTLTVN